MNSEEKDGSSRSHTAVGLSNRNPGAGRRNPYTKPLRCIEIVRDKKESMVAYFTV
jgi:hypothetical protein